MKLLVFGIHPDDVELGCGGTVAVCAARGDRVVIADLTRGECSSNGSPEERALEAVAGARLLGASERRNLALPDGAVQSENPAHMKVVVGAIREAQPDVVLVPNPDDPHPDHENGGRLILRALYMAGIRGFAPDAGSAWKAPATLVYSGRHRVRADIVVDITRQQPAKMNAIRTHVTQFGTGGSGTPTPLNAPGFLAVVESRDREVGHLAGYPFGEAFSLVRPLGLPDLSVFTGDGNG